MSRLNRVNLLIASCAISLAACSTYSSGGSARTVQLAPSTRVTATAAAGPVSVTITAEQAAAIRAYYGRPSSGPGRGRGRGRGGGLPPGIAKNLERGKPLPPGIAAQHLPRELLVRLPRPANGLEYLVVAGKLLLVEAATQVVHDVLLETVFG
jgi:hypothetical protein